jgi:hypothetical protein
LEGESSWTVDTNTAAVAILFAVLNFVIIDTGKETMSITTAHQGGRTCMSGQSISAQRLMLKLTAYFVLLFGSVIAIGTFEPELLSAMPLGGTDALDIVAIERDERSLSEQFSPPSRSVADQVPTARQIALIAAFLSLSLGGTILVMLPIAWTYSATKKESGYRRNFVRALLVLPICATTIVLLIQDNLALAFGLAAMVAAVRFRVALQEAMDGIYIFSSICVGLAAGIGHLGIAAILAVFFCYANALLWHIEFGRNPIDDARIAKKRAKLDVPAASTDSTQEFPRK